MELSISQRKAVTKVIATRYKRSKRGAKISEKYDNLGTPYQRVLADEVTVLTAIKNELALEHKLLNPAAIQRQIQALASELLTLTTSKQGPKTQPATRALSNESSIRARQAS